MADTAGTTFHLRRYALGRQPSLEITKPEYESILVARAHSLEHLALEELFDLLMGNYEEFERELLAVALKGATHTGSFRDWSESRDIVQLVARRFANLLSSAQGYCDQLPHSISTLFGPDSNQLASVKQYLKDEHAATFGYRVCAELRRYVQHRGSAVHVLHFSSDSVQRDHNRRVRVYRIAPQVNVTRLYEDSKVNVALLEQLEAGVAPTSTGERLRDIRPHVREYLSALGRIQVKVRTLVEDDVAKSDAIVTEAIERFANVSDHLGIAGLAAMELSEHELLDGRHPTFLMKEPLERRRELALRNHLPTHFDDKVVTNEVD